MGFLNLVLIFKYISSENIKVIFDMYNSSIMYNFYQKEDIVTFFGNMLSKCFSDHTVHLLYYISLSFQKDHRIDILFEIYTQVILKHLDKIRCRLCSENTLIFFEFYIFGF